MSSSPSTSPSSSASSSPTTTYSLHSPTFDPFYDHFAYYSSSSKLKSKKGDKGRRSRTQEQEFIFTRQDHLYDHFSLRTYSTSAANQEGEEKQRNKGEKRGTEEGEYISNVTINEEQVVPKARAAESFPTEEHCNESTRGSSSSKPPGSFTESSNPSSSCTNPSPDDEISQAPRGASEISLPAFPPKTASRFEIQDYLHALLLTQETPNLPPFALYNLTYSGRDLHAMAHGTTKKAADLTLEFVAEVMKRGMSPQQAELVHGEILAAGNAGFSVRRYGEVGRGGEGRAWEVYHKKKKPTVVGVGAPSLVLGGEGREVSARRATMRTHSRSVEVLNGGVLVWIRELFGRLMAYFGVLRSGSNWNGRNGKTALGVQRRR